MAIYDINGNVITGGEATGDFDRVFDTEEVIIPQGVEFPFTTGTFYAYPYEVRKTLPSVVVKMKDANGAWVTGTTSDGETIGRADIGNWAIRPDSPITFTETGGSYSTYITEEEFAERQPHGGLSWTFDSQPVTMMFTVPVSLNKAFREGEELESGELLHTKIDTEKSTGLIEQIGLNIADLAWSALTGGDFTEIDETRRKLKSAMIRHTNAMNDAIRLGTFNIKGSGGFSKNNWRMLKICFENFGIDICGLQEVSFPLNEPKFKDYFEGWLFPYASENGDDYRKGDGAEYEGKNERMLLSKFPIDSTEETFLSLGTDYRYVAKSVLSLPRYHDKRGSENLKMSVYNTQLEVGSPEMAQAQARMILAMAQADENPFVIIMGDSNDFTLTKEVWKIFENGGFTPVIDTLTATTGGTWDSGCIDNFFINHRIKAVNWDVIFAQRFPWYNNEMLSDHDLVIADVQLDYSDIRCIYTNLTNCTIDYTKGWFTPEETVTITVTADSGYTFQSMSVCDCQMVNEEAFTISDNTVIIDGSKLTGDVYLRATAVEESAS